MTYRRRHRWLRRLALGLAFATFAAPAAAKPGDGVRYVTAGGWSGYVDSETGIPVSAGIPQGDEPTKAIPDLTRGIFTEAGQATAAAEAIHDPYLTDVFVRQGESLGGPDGRPQSSQSVLGESVKTQQAEAQLLNQRQLETLAAENGASAATRPDDRADRFAHSDVASQPEPAGTSKVESHDGFTTVGIGALMLALALGLGVAFVKRPKLAGV